MSFRINTNVNALYAERVLGQTGTALSKSIERLSSGLRINRASDDAAGFAVSERMRTQINGLDQAQRNGQDATSLIQVAEGGLSQISDMLQRLRTLAVQSANDTLTTSDRATIQIEVNQLLKEINRQASTVSFNSKNLLNGSFSAVSNKGASYKGSLLFQVGANKGETIALTIATASAAGFGIGILSVAGAQTATVTLVSSIITASGTGRDGVVTRAGAESAITLLTTAITKVSGLRAELGAIQNRLDQAVSFAGIGKENLSAAESRIRDLDFASEIINFTKNQILQQTGVSALSQANVGPQVVLSLLQ